MLSDTNKSVINGIYYYHVHFAYEETKVKMLCSILPEQKVEQMKHKNTKPGLLIQGSVPLREKQIYI